MSTTAILEFAAGAQLTSVPRHNAVQAGVSRGHSRRFRRACEELIQNLPGMRMARCFCQGFQAFDNRLTLASIDMPVERYDD